MLSPGGAAAAIVALLQLWGGGLPGRLQAQGTEPVDDAPPAVETGEAQLAQRFKLFLETADVYMSRAEKAVFLALERDYQRDAFIDQFWRVRDPFPETTRNELKDRYERLTHLIPSLYGSFEDARGRILLVHGEPANRLSVNCTKTRVPVEVWVYLGSEQVPFEFVLVFFEPRPGEPAQIWRPSSGAGEEVLRASRRCLKGDQMAQAVSWARGRGAEYDRMLSQVLAKPRPRSREWLATFVALSTDLPEEAERFPATTSFVFPGRRDSRTVVQGILDVPLAEVAVGDYAGYRSVDFQLTGEVILDDRLFESFRYKYGFPAEDLPVGRLPLGFQRHLRSGTYRLILKLEDLNGGRFFRSEEDLVVPAVDRLLPPPPPTDLETAEIFAEATEAVARGETTIRIVPPHGELLTGPTRIDTLAVGEDIQRVAFFLDDKPLLTKTRPPFNVEIDLGPYPELHELRVEASDDQGHEVATDELILNAGGNRFVVRLVEPRRGRTYHSSLQAQVDVEAPEGRSVERVEIYLNELLVSTLYQPPYAQPIPLPPGQPVAYVRAVAYLPDGNSSEDLVFINAPEYLEEIDVQTVELYTTVFDRQGRPVQGLGPGDFRIFEDGVEQKIARFERVEDLPIHALVLLDASASMRPHLEEVRRAALSFFAHGITPRDRAGLVTFNKFPRLAVKMTNDQRQLGGGLAGLTAEGETALYDSLIFGLYYLAGIKGERALLLLSDGRDEGSRFSFDEAVEYARRAGVTVYPIGLQLPLGGPRSKLGQIAEETGGRSFFVSDASELEGVYQTIQHEVRSQYLLVYQSSNTGEERDFRQVELKMADSGHKAKTLSGYYP